MKFSLPNVLGDASNNPALQALLLQQVTRIQVEFLRDGGAKKPHAVLRLFLESPMMFPKYYNRHGKKCCDFVSVGSCMLDSNNRPLDDMPDGGTLLRLYPDFDMHEKGLVSFNYNVAEKKNLREYISAIYGTLEELPPLHKSNLSRFHLGRIYAGTVSEAVDGCRDVVTQWVIRLNVLGWMNWEADGIVDGARIQKDDISLMFHEFIAKGYKDVRNEIQKRTSDIRIIQITEQDIPMHKGNFTSTAAEDRRQHSYRGFTLPYI